VPRLLLAVDPPPLAELVEDEGWEESAVSVLRFLPWSGGSIKTCTQLARLLVLQRLEESFLQSTFFPAGLWRRQEDGEGSRRKGEIRERLSEPA
jgi:hypothetical protein